MRPPPPPPPHRPSWKLRCRRGCASSSSSSSPSSSLSSPDAAAAAAAARDARVASVAPSLRPEPSAAPGPMMRIVVAGGGGLGYLLASKLSNAANAYNARSEFAELDVQLHVVDYDDCNRLAFALQGVDLVVSTIRGRAQINLIHAAVRGRVRVFVPSEFEGCLSRRPQPADSMDRDSAQALELLRHLSRHSHIRYTVFSCGLFMERFHPYGLAYLNISRGAAIANPGGYLVDINRATAEFADRDARGRPVRVCLSSVYDVVRFLAAAVDLGIERWPVEFTMYGDRMSLHELVDTCSSIRNVAFHRQTCSIVDLQGWIGYYTQAGDAHRAAYYQRLLATANGRYDFSRATLNDTIARSDPGVLPPMTLSQWLNRLNSMVRPA